ncbi:MAG: HDOD domain-containing protein [Rhodocyclaceae bacterium]|nr:HDOD domain-containing protein [Rhodocyclaceae bacterium]
MDKSALYRRIAEEAGRGELVFPTSTEVGLRIKRLLDDPDCSLEQVAKLVQAEPLLAARVVAVANSVAFNRSGREISDVRQAISRLGFRTLRSLAMSLLVRQLASQSPLPAHQALSQQLWSHTTHVAALAHVIARRVTHQDAETALLAGILHEVAGFYLIARARDIPELLADGVEGWQGEGEPIVGAALLKLLEVPEGVVAAIADLWQGYLAIPPISLGDTLLLAEELAPVPSPLYWAPPVEAAAEAGVPRLEIALDEETLSGILAESAAEVRSLIEALK